jgi:hypothetical protein
VRRERCDLPAALSKDDALRTGTWTVNPTPRTLNGGLYNGAPFVEHGGWGNVPMEPQQRYIRKGFHGSSHHLRARTQAVFNRPGSIGVSSDRRS